MRWRRAPGELARRLFGDGRSSLMGDGAVGRRLEPKSRAAAGVAQRRDSAAVRAVLPLRIPGDACSRRSNWAKGGKEQQSRPGSEHL